MSQQGHPRTGERVTAPLRPVQAAPGATTGAPPPHSGPVAQQVQHLRAASKAVVDACPAVSAWLGAQCRVAAQLMMRDTRQNYLWTTAERPRNKKYHVECASLVAPSATGLCEHCGITFVPGKNCRVRRTKRRRGRKAAPGGAKPQAARTLLQCIHCMHTALLTPGRNERVQAQQTPPAVAPQQEVATPTPDSKKLSTHGTPAAPPTASPLGLAAFLAEVT